MLVQACGNESNSRVCFLHILGGLAIRAIPEFSAGAGDGGQAFDGLAALVVSIVLLLLTCG